MAIEHASVQVARKPWGVGDLHPWSSMDVSSDPVGELWFQRADKNAPIPALLFKLLFTSEPLSIQVHPDDEFARSIGLPNGKTEAWYMLAAAPGARVAIGLKQRLTPEELRASIRDGSIANLTQWRPVAKGSDFRQRARDRSRPDAASAEDRYARKWRAVELARPLSRGAALVRDVSGSRRVRPDVSRAGATSAQGHSCCIPTRRSHADRCS